MKILLTAINAKYIHSNLAVYSLCKYAQMHGCLVEVAEYTINNQIETILEQIYRRRPDVLFFSCYIWNIEYVKELAAEFHRLCPDVPIWVGGPEVSYETTAFLQQNPSIFGVLTGEGEETFLELCRLYQVRGEAVEKSLGDVKGLVYRTSRNTIFRTEERPLLDMDKLPFCYDEIEDFQNRIVYYESSRGCPYACSYCLSSVDKRLRFRSLELVLKELQFFMDKNVPQVKFVDRTFNCKHEHAMAIWEYLAKHDNGITNFHFEISADLLRDEELALLRTLRPGQVQFEIGVQTVNAAAIKEIRRTMDMSRLEKNVSQIKAAGNIHQHLDLIAGLPYEDLDSFKSSFDTVYRMRPEQLQLGFLKVLKGSYMYEHQKEYTLLYRNKPPYEVLSTKWIAYEDLLRLKQIEEVLEIHYNSGQFLQSLKLLAMIFESPFDMYDKLGRFYLQNGHRGQNYSRMNRSQIFLEFACQQDKKREPLYREALTFDLYVRENAKNRPVWADKAAEDKKQQLRYLRHIGWDKKYCHLECFSTEFLQMAGIIKETKDKEQLWLLFDYEDRNVMTNEAKVIILGDSLDCKRGPEC